MNDCTSTDNIKNDTYNPQQQQPDLQHNEQQPYQITPLIQRSVLQRLDVGPFILGYICCIVFDQYTAFSDIGTVSITASVSVSIVSIIYAILLLLHINLVLASQWYISIQLHVGYYKVSIIKTKESSLSKQQHYLYGKKWTHCFVQPIHTNNNENSSNGTIKTSRHQNVSYVGGGIVPIIYEDGTKYMVPSTTNYKDDKSTKKKSISAITIMKIIYQDRMFRACYYDDNDADSSYDSNESYLIDDRTLWMEYTKSQMSTKQFSMYNYAFRSVDYPIHLPISYYMSYQGHATIQSCSIAQSIYGNNTTIIQLPTLHHLVCEQMIQPLFIFQLLCIVLWCFDEYWYYSIYTLFALVILEYTLAYSKIKSLQRLHTIGNRNQYQKVFVKRGVNDSRSSTSSSTDKYIWMKILVSELVPGDIIRLHVMDDPIPIPADIVLLHGTAVCDEALLTGESIPQLKHSLQPQQSSSSSNGIVSERLDMNDSYYKESILFGGTTLLVSTPATEDELTSTSASNDPTQDGIIGMVLRTGFETSQGNLLRTMIHSSSNQNNKGHNTMDTFVFIVLLLCCAVCAAIYVLYYSWYDTRRNQYKLTLHVIIIITSVVPPELPMELNLAITNSVADLVKRCQVYCTEHYRIPYAGQINICCFDKTGTLTSDEMQLKGVRLFADNDIVDVDEDNTLKHPLEDEIQWTTLRVMTACHSLATANINRTSTGSSSKRTKLLSTQVVGDPLEVTVLRETGYQLIGNNTVAPCIESNGEGSVVQNGTSHKTINILHRFSFSSKLKRMTVLCTEGDSIVWAVSKGAPETIKELLADKAIPANYDEIAFYHMSRGRRVLAMAYRDVGNIRTLQALKNNGRDKIETELLFAGFLVLDCPLKPDSKSIVTELKKSGLSVVMITGDAILTAAEVARQVGIIRRPPSGKRAVFEVQEKKGILDNKSIDPLTNFHCIPLGRNVNKDEQGNIHLPQLKSDNIANLLRMSKQNEIAFCITGDTLVKLATMANNIGQTNPTGKSIRLDEKFILMTQASQSLLQTLVPIISVFARHSPHQKEAVVAAFNASGYHTLMCGDGTNDVGALKRAHVGISIISAPNVEKKQRDANATLTKIKSNDKTGSGTSVKKSSKVSKKSSHQHQRASTIEESLRQLRQAQEELDHVELGDASIAAPFTSRAVSIKCCKDVIQQGRCTLVTMLQIYKILGINCLVNAFVLSELFLHGVKQGDRQLTGLGLAVASLFYFVTRAEPLSSLSTIQPPTSVLCSEAILSIVGQCCIHIIMIIIVTECALSYVDPFDPSLVPDGAFNPNVLNTCTFLLTCVATINTFAMNYYGRPYMKDVIENKLFYRTIRILYILLLVCTMEIFLPLNDLLQLTPLSNHTTRMSSSTSAGSQQMLYVYTTMIIDSVIQQCTFPGFITIIMILDTLLSFAYERMIRKIYTKTIK